MQARNVSSAGRPHVVIIGGGFGGLAAARELATADVAVTLVDRRNHHLFQPLLYQVAMAALNPGDIAYPIRAILRKQKNTRVLLAEAQGIDMQARRVTLDNGHIDFDYLIIACGARSSWFGNTQWTAVAPGLKSIEDALEIRRRVFLAYEAAERESDPQQQQNWQTFVVIGGGPTGVELAGALAEIGRHTLKDDFRHTDPRAVRVVLIEGRERVLGSFSASLSDAATEALRKLGVEVRTGARVTAIDDQSVTLADGERIATRTVIWAAGVEAAELTRTVNSERDRAGRLAVNADLSMPADARVFAVGDCAGMRSEGKDVPGMAQGAMQSGRHAARQIRADLAGRPRTSFVYRDLGAMATIGRASAIAEIRRWKQSGFFAWLFWWVLHIWGLIGFRSRMSAFMNWAWHWLTFQRGARLVTGGPAPLPAVSPARAQHRENDNTERPDTPESLRRSP